LRKFIVEAVTNGPATFQQDGNMLSALNQARSHIWVFLFFCFFFHIYLLVEWSGAS
jgi:hypothetical protein